jgi:foldase protein PrsA
MSRGMRAAAEAMAAVAAVAVLVGLGPAWAGASPGAAPAGAATTTQPAVRVPPGAVAVVNGAPISEKEFTDALIERHGTSMMKRLVENTLIRQEMTRRRLAVTDAEVEALLLQRIAAEGGQAAFAERLRAMGVPVEYVKKYELWPAVALRKLTEGSVTVTDAEVELAFQANYGEQRQVRRIVADDPRVIADIERELKEGKDFAEVARRRSLDPVAARNGGLLPPIGRGLESNKVVEDFIFTKLKVGETSGIVGVNDRFFIIKLEAIVPARTDVKFEDVKAAVRAAVLQQRMAQAAQTLVAELRKKAQIAERPDLTGEE